MCPCDRPDRHLGRCSYRRLGRPKDTRAPYVKRDPHKRLLPNTYVEGVKHQLMDCFMTGDGVGYAKALAQLRVWLLDQGILPKEGRTRVDRSCHSRINSMRSQ